MIEPRGEHSISAQLPPVLVWMDVVRIIGSRAVVPEGPEESPVCKTARAGAIVTVRLFRHPAEERVQVAAGERPGATTDRDRRVGSDRYPVDLEIDEIRL